ncbi:hypothetical protein Tco_0860171 [Tanacetum coccineum]|uniref:Uncharacterized protein n=1 Tax=Tanacetum coccineum TaxID=301880 RepID=A0ABQ5BFX1_9ASTR
MKENFKELEAEVDQNIMDRKCDKIERKNLLISNENLIADCLSKDVFYTATNFVLTVSRFSELHNAHTVEQARCLEFKAEISTLKHNIQKDDHKSAKIKQHYKELYDSVKITRAKTIENTTALLAENENLKAQIVEKMKCVIMDSVKSKVLPPVINPNPDFFNNSPNFSDYTPQPQYQTYSCELCGNDARYGHYCTPFDQIEPPRFPVIHQPPQETSLEFLQDKINLINSMQTFLGKFKRFSFYETPKVVSLAWEIVSKIEHAFEDKQYQPEGILELFRKLHDDVQNIHEELAELDTIPATELDEVIKSSVENLVQIPSESEGIPDKMCDVPFHDNSPPLNISKDQFEGFSNSNDDSTSIDDASFSIDDIDYV